MELGTTIAVIGACLLAEAFFSGAELALIAADKVALRHLAERGGERGRLIARHLADPGQLISAALVGTNICVVLSTVVATLSLLPRFPRQAELISLGVMTPLVLVFGEIVPKSLFQHYADRLAPKLIYIISGFRIAFFPLVLLGSWFSSLLLRLFREAQHRAFIGRDELRLLIKLPSAKGADRITVDEKQMISRIFELSERTVEDVMLPLSEVTALPVSASLRDVAREIADKRHTRIPLFRDRVDKVEGIIHAFDVLRADPDADPCTLCRPPIFVPENQPVVDTLLRLQREGQGMAVVVDEYGGATGLVTIEEIIEEVVGEIEDEYDEEPEDLIRREGPGIYRVNARATVENVNGVARLQLPMGEDYETVAGLVLDQLKVIPPVGRQLWIGNTSITVTKATERAIVEVLVQARRRRKTVREAK